MNWKKIKLEKDENNLNKEMEDFMWKITEIVKQRSKKENIVIPYDIDNRQVITKLNLFLH